MPTTIDWSDNPQFYRRQYPNWFRIYRFLSKTKVSVEWLSTFLPISCSLIDETHKVPAMIYSKPGQYSFFDAATVAVLAQNPENPDYLIHNIHGWDEMMWDAFVGTVLGFKIVIQTNYKDCMWCPHIDDGSSEQGFVPINLSAAIEQLLPSWPYSIFSARKENSGQWSFEFFRSRLPQIGIPGLSSSIYPFTITTTG